MKLEDFFTLAEMKNGLTAPARVEELLSVMQKESDCVVKNFDESVRQWSAVASTLAATENKDSLDLFIKLDGIQFLNHWLQKAQKCCDRISDCTVEESIIVLLGALQKLPIDQECSISSGVVVTVKDLFGHKSSRVQDRARALFDSWNQGRDIDSSKLNIDKNGSPCDNEVSASTKLAVKSEQSAVEISSFRENCNAENHVLESAATEISQSRNSVGSNPGGVEDVKTLTANNHDTSCNTLIWPGKDKGVQDAQDSISTEKRSSIPPAEGTASTEVLYSAVPMEVDPNPPTQESMKGPSILNHVGAEGSDSCLQRFSDSNMSVLASKLDHETVDLDVPNHSGSRVMHEAPIEGVECCSIVLQDLSHDGDVSRKPENPESFSCRIEDSSPVKDESELIVGVGGGVVSIVNADVSKPKMDAKDSNKIDRRSDSEFKCDMNDALGVVLQVAKELEQEAGNDGESFCSSSEKNYCKVEQPFSPDSVKGEQIDETKTKEGHFGGVSPLKGVEQVTSSNNADAGIEDCVQDTVSSLVTESAQDASNSGKGMLDFDLNEEVNPEEMECPNTPVSDTISSLAASVTPDGCKIGSVKRSDDSSEQRQHLLEIDLNVAEGGVDGAADTILTDQIPVSSCLLSGESSIEVSSRRAERHNLDLNRIGDNDDAPSSHGREGKPFYHHLDERNNPSPAASSSSRQPFLINIDLNENLSFLNDAYDQQTEVGQSISQDKNSCGNFKQDDDHVICIMGTRVEANIKDSAPSQSVLPNGQSMGASLARQQCVLGLQHAGACPPQLYGYNGFTVGPSTSLSAVYGSGSVPFMVDSRGAPVVPQIIGSAMAFPPTYSSQPFPMSLNSTPFDLNGVGPTRAAAFDLNSSLMMAEGGVRELGGWRPGQSQLEECMWSNSQYSSSGLGLKRKEPDGGWELYPISCKQQLQR